MFEKIVRRVEPGAASIKSDDQAFFDLLTFELGFGNEDQSLSKMLAQLNESGMLDEHSAKVVADAVERLQKVDALLEAHGF